MDEAQIATQLAKKIQPSEPQSPVEIKPTVSDPAEVPIEYKLDELTQYKLHQHFGEEYRESDEKARTQLAYIYEEIAERLGTKEYPIIVAKINDLKRMLGLNYTDNARYKLYQWLKLDQRRSSIEQEMSNLHG